MTTNQQARTLAGTAPAGVFLSSRAARTATAAADRRNPILNPAGGATAAGITSDRTLRRSSAKRTYLHLQHVANAAKQIDRLPDAGESIHCIMRGNFHAWDLIPAALQLAGADVVIEQLYVATLGFNEQNGTELCSLIDGGAIGRVTFLCSHYFREASGEIYQPLADRLLARGQRIAAIRTHAKIQAYTLTDGRAFVIESSANLRSCRNIEQFVFTHDRALFDFHAGWMDEVFAQWPDGKQPTPPPPQAKAKRPR